MGALKLAASFLLIACLFKSLPAYSQRTHLISLKEQDASLQKVLDDIHQQTGYTYFGEANWVQYSHRVSFTVRKMPLRQVLDSCFKDQPFRYEIIGNAISIQPRPVKEMVVHGFVYNEKKEPLEGVTILVRGEPAAAAISKVNGEFAIRTRFADDKLVISSVNYETMEVLPREGEEVTVYLREKVGELSEVVIHTGYQVKNQNVSTGAEEVIGTALIDRRVSTTLLDRIDGVTSSVLFNKNIVAGTNQSSITIRGRSTIFANPNPLIVIDNFPYNGDISNINPEDVESITILKDAAAAAIWGAFSGNGVIVITTKKGRYNQAPKFSFTTSQTVGEKPDQYYQPRLSSGDYIDIQQFLYRKGWYNTQLSSFQHGAVTPAVEIFYATTKGLLSPADSAAQINVLKGIDSRSYLDKYFYQHSLNSQYALNVSGGGSRDQYFLSAGYDENKSNLVRDLYRRATLNGNSTHMLIPDKLELSTGLSFAAGKTYLNNIATAPIFYPYAALADAHGNPLPVNFGLKNSYIDTAGGGQLLDWHYIPLNELKYADNTYQWTDYRINIGLRFVIRKGLDVRAYYQYGRGDSSHNNYQSIQTYYTRNLINNYAQYNNGVFSFPIPMGGILYEQRNSYTVNNARLQVNYRDTLFRHGLLNVIGGTEIRDIEQDLHQDQLYGYEKGVASSIAVDYVTAWPQYSNPNKLKIPYLDLYRTLSERYLSYYLNADYTYLGRYTLSASARRDESNLFGVETNQRGVPLWSVGGAWQLSKEDFYRVAWLPFLKLRVTDGYNGNVDRSTAAFTTANINPGGNSYGASSSTIANPANPSLRWERINTFNVGLDFSTQGDRFGGSLDYYIKSGQDLIGLSPLDPTVGITPFRSNTAGMIDHGIDVAIHSNNMVGTVRWNSVLLFSFVRDRVTVYKEKIGPVSTYLSSIYINPFVGRPLYALYALPWEGLDPQTGDPQGLLNGKISKEYGSIYNSANLNDLVYMGPLNPRAFGGWRNSLSWRQWGLSWNIVYKLGYVFRRNSIFYSQVFNGQSFGHPDYERRWQSPGDEKTTNVPSIVFTTDKNRDNFYQNSTVLVEKGDHIRLQDVQLSYDLERSAHPRLPVSLVRFYLYANNLGILCKANHAGVDPDFVTGIPNPRTLAIGVKTEF